MSEQTSNSWSVPEWDLADRMRKTLRHADVSVQDMADYLEVSRNTVGSWINGRIRPNASTLRAWALRCGVPYEWLRDGKTGPDDGSTPPSTKWYIESSDLAEVVSIPRAA